MLFASVFAGQEVKIIPTTILTFDEIFVQLVEKSADFLIFNDQLQQQQCLEPLKLNPSNKCSSYFPNKLCRLNLKKNLFPLIMNRCK